MTCRIELHQALGVLFQTPLGWYTCHAAAMRINGVEHRYGAMDKRRVTFCRHDVSGRLEWVGKIDGEASNCLIAVTAVFSHRGRRLYDQRNAGAIIRGINLALRQLFRNCIPRSGGTFLPIAHTFIAGEACKHTCLVIWRQSTSDGAFRCIDTYLCHQLLLLPLLLHERMNW